MTYKKSKHVKFNFKIIAFHFSYTIITYFLQIFVNIFESITKKNVIMFHYPNYLIIT